MKHFVEHIIEPDRLLLAWQSPAGCKRARFIVGELLRSGETVSLRYLRDSKGFHNAVECGFQGYPAFVKTEKDYSIGVVDAFMRRLPPRSRGDFSKYLKRLRISEDVSISDFALLGYSGAKLPSDGFSLIHPFDNAHGPCEFLLEVAGFRYMTDIKIEDVAVGYQASFKPEPDNQFDPAAIKVVVNEKHIGYVNRGQTAAIHRWIMEGNIRAFVERINGRPDRPLVYLFVEVFPKSEEMNNGNAFVGVG